MIQQDSGQRGFAVAQRYLQLNIMLTNSGFHQQASAVEDLAVYHEISSPSSSPNAVQGPPAHYAPMLLLLHWYKLHISAGLGM